MLLDTNIVSYIYKGDSRAAAYQHHLLGHQWYISFMTLAEIYRWPYAQNWADPRRLALERFVHSRFVILPFNQKLAWTWAELTGRTMRGQPMSIADSWIAATALQHAMPLVTHNARHFKSVPGLTLITEQ
ncbi:MAG: type II toxin-antitoxin system VapC family toxin [Roseimicrobium sp.]